MKRVCDAKSSKCPKKAGLALLSREGKGSRRATPLDSFLFSFIFYFLSTTGYDVRVRTVVCNTVTGNGRLLQRCQHARSQLQGRSWSCGISNN